AGIMPFQPFQAGGRAPECRQCGRTFRSLEELVAHLQTHAANWPYKCSVCSRAFRSRGPLVVHERNHLTGEPFECDYCLAVFPTKENLIRRSSSPPVLREFECRMCSKQVKYRTGVDHYSRFHANRQPRLCRACLGGLFRKRNRGTHLHADKPHKCRHCPRAFAKMWGLVVHMRKHSKGKTFKCEHCTREFRQNSSFVIHVRTHGEGKPLKCWVCAQLFEAKDELVEHLNSHPTKLL
ncbi:zinc finger, C2H2 type, putative, partial [Ixodes scapularis]